MRNVLIFIIILIFFIVITIFVLRYKRKRNQNLLQDMDGHDFEFYCADLLNANGFSEIEVTKGSGDYGIDIFANREEITYAIQCKHYNKPVGIKAIQEAYFGRDYYGKMVGVVMTNHYFTVPAIEAAEKLNILLWDKDKISEFVQKGNKLCKR